MLAMSAASIPLLLLASGRPGGVVAAAIVRTGLEAVLAWYLYTGRRWARTLTIFFLGLGALFTFAFGAAATETLISVFFYTAAALFGTGAVVLGFSADVAAFLTDQGHRYLPPEK